MQQEKETKIPFRERNVFQAFLERQMLGENPSYEDEVNWAKIYAEKITDIINDDVQNSEIQSLIMSEMYEAAAQKVLELLKQ